MDTISEERTVDIESTAKHRRMGETSKRQSTASKRKKSNAGKQRSQVNNTDDKGDRCSIDKYKDLKKKYDDLK